jgi:peptide-methionine (S)-S-oxide reductase
VTKQSLVGQFPENFEIATFGMGCFWCSEGHFAHLASKASGGIHITRVGYAQGDTENPTYEEVCTGRTNHVEVVQIVYDPSVITFISLLKDFWELHDPTTPMRQGNDVGTQYRSGIYYSTDVQRQAAEESKNLYQQALNDRGISAEIVTEIEPLRKFFLAEEYHQQYDLKPGSRQYCGMRPTGVQFPSRPNSPQRHSSE